jgi:hypothetical protein
MKKLILIVIVGLFTNPFLFAGSEPPKCQNQMDFSIVFVSKAYWDGPSKSCLDRERGCCIHIGFNTIIDGLIIGKMAYSDGTGLIFTIPKKTGILQSTYDYFIRNGNFYMNGEGTFSEELLKKLGLPDNYTIRSGNYPVQVNGEEIKVIFK